MDNLKSANISFILALLRADSPLSGYTIYFLPRDSLYVLLLYFWIIIPQFVICACALIPLVVSNLLQPHGLYLARLLCPWGFSRQELPSSICNTALQLCSLCRTFYVKLTIVLKFGFPGSYLATLRIQKWRNRITCTWNLKKWYKFLQSINRPPNKEDKLMITKGERAWGKYSEYIYRLYIFVFMGIF